MPIFSLLLQELFFSFKHCKYLFQICHVSINFIHYTFCFTKIFNFHKLKFRFWYYILYLWAKSFFMTIKIVKNDFFFFVKQQTSFLQNCTWVSSNGIGLLYYLSNSKGFYICRLEWTMILACSMHAKEFFSPNCRRPFEEVIYSQQALAISKCCLEKLESDQDWVI